jgi:hypothetical protein
LPPELVMLESVDSLTVRPWRDPVIDVIGQHPCSSYVETFYLGVLGPSTTWLLRHVVTTLEASGDDGFVLDLAETARRLGLGERSGRNSPLVRTVGRLVRFGLAQLEEPAAGEVDVDVSDGGGGQDGGDDIEGDVDGDGWRPLLSVRRRVPPLTRAQITRLPPLLQSAHARWNDQQLRTPVVEQQRRRARQLALSYLDAGLGSEETEHQLVRLGYHPALCNDATRWASERHATAMTAATSMEVVT